MKVKEKERHLYWCCYCWKRAAFCKHESIWYTMKQKKLDDERK